MLVSVVTLLLCIRKTRRMRWVEYIAHMGEMRNTYESLVGKSEGKRPHGRPRHR
jgi:hypothetical protein